MLAKLFLGATLFLSAAQAQAQALVPFELNMDRVSFDNKGKFAASKTYFIPTVYVHISARKTVEAKNEGAQTKARVFVDGLDKPMLQALVSKVYEDLIGKMRTAGYTVISYSDIKAELAGLDRMKPNEKYGFPTRLLDRGDGIDFAIIAPSDEQTFDFGITGPVRPFVDIAKGKNVMVLVPQIYLNVPQVTSEKGGWGGMRSVSMKIEPPMILDGAAVYGLPPDLGWANIRVLQHGKRLVVDVAGKVQKLDQDTTKFGEWSRTVADFSFALDPAALTAGVLRVGYAINDLTVSTINKAHQ